MVLFLLAALCLIATGLLFPMRVKFFVRAEGFYPSFFVDIAFFYRLLHVRVTGIVTVFPKIGLLVARGNTPYKKIMPKAKRKKPEKNKGRALPLSFLRQNIEACRLDSLGAFGRVGIEDDAFQTVMACGLLRVFFETAGKAVKSRVVSIAPDFNGPVFWLKLEGILTIHSTQIIGAALKRRFGLSRKTTRRKVA